MKIKSIVLGIGIFVVFTLVLFQGLETFYPTPAWEDYCSSHSSPIATGDTQKCKNIPELQIKADNCWNSKGEFVYEYDLNGCVINGYCDDCRIDYEKELDIHSNRVFIIAIIVGILVFVVGLFLLATEPVGSALMASGIWSLFYGVIKNWRNFSESWRFLILFVLLIVLIWIALKFNSKRKLGFFKKH